MKHLFSPLVLLFFCSHFLSAQILPPAPPLNNTITGTIWKDAGAQDGLRDGTETPIAGILVKLLTQTTPVAVVATATTESNGNFTLKVSPAAYPSPSYRIEYVFPSSGFGLTTARVGTDNTINSAATSSGSGANTKYYSPYFTLASSSDSPNIYGLGLTANPNTLTYCTTKESTATDWGLLSESDPGATQVFLTLPKSEVAPVPTSVTIWGSESVYHPTAGIENTSPATSAYKFTFKGRVSMTLPGNVDYPGNSSAPEIAATSSVLKQGNLSAYDGTTDFTGVSGTAFFNQFGFATGSFGYAPEDIDFPTYFIGSGTFDIPTAAEGVTELVGGANLVTLVTTYASAGACVVYAYEEGALPVTLISFTAKSEAKTANLNWKTTEETNSERFDIQRSSDSKNWNVIGTVKSHGESKVTVSYAFTDNAPVNGSNFYRLKMIDRDGTSAYTRIQALRFDGQPSAVTVYPNPAVNELNVATTGNNQVAKIEIVNQSGRLVKETSDLSRPVDVTRLSNGIYSIKTIYTNGATDKNKVVVAH